MARRRAAGKGPGLKEEVLQRVVGRIEEHVGDSLRLAVLGRVAGMSPSQFGRLFKVSTGRAPHAYVLQRRMAKAEHLLRCRIQIVVDQLVSYTLDKFAIG